MTGTIWAQSLYLEKLSELPDTLLITSLKELPHEMLLEFWTYSSSFTLLNLLVYNTSLADVETDPISNLTPDFSNSLPLLWLRHKIRLAPAEYFVEIDVFADYDSILTIFRKDVLRLLPFLQLLFHHWGK